MPDNLYYNYSVDCSQLDLINIAPQLNNGDRLAQPIFSILSTEDIDNVTNSSRDNITTSRVIEYFFTFDVVWDYFYEGTEINIGFVIQRCVHCRDSECKIKIESCDDGIALNIDNIDTDTEIIDFVIERTESGEKSESVDFQYADNNDINNYYLQISLCSVSFEFITNMIFPGDRLYFDYTLSISCYNRGKEIPYSVLLYSEELDIDHIITISASEVSFGHEICQICDANNENCHDCSMGILPKYDPIYEQAEYKINVNTIDNNVYCETSQLLLSFESCGIGKGIENIADSVTYDCNECELFEFKLVNGFKECYKCDQHSIGYQCLGGFDILITFNYWMAGLNQTNQFISLLHVENNTVDTLYAHFCAVKSIYILCFSQICNVCIFVYL